MFDEEKIPVAKLREAFNLNEHDVDKLIMQLWPEHVFPWEIWEAAYKKHWKSASIDNAEYFKIPFTPFPTTKGIWDFSQARWCRTQMCVFVSAMIYALPAQYIESGFEYICTEVYDHPEIAYKDERKILFDRLYEIENGFDWRFFMPIDWDRLEQVLNDKAYHIGRGKKDFISAMFFDTVLLNKFAACTIMVKYSYPKVKEVKGITTNYMDFVIAKFNEEHLFSKKISDASNHDRQTVRVSTSLWNGKDPVFIIKQMREAGYSNEIIAHILFYKRGVKKKREIGKLLGGQNLSDFAYDKIGKELLETAALIQIQDIA